MNMNIKDLELLNDLLISAYGTKFIIDPQTKRAVFYEELQPEKLQAEELEELQAEEEHPLFALSVDNDADFKDFTTKAVEVASGYCFTETDDITVYKWNGSEFKE